ncbi:hypothetical protein [Paenibacillus konkukensis]|nr:hypothetical protein [Paenibacillus konkukensis]
MITMTTRTITWGIAVLTISAIALTSVISSNAAQESLAEKYKNYKNDVTFEPVPEAILEDHKHPDFIVTKDGQYAKILHMEKNFSQDETAYDEHNTTDKTKVIVVHGDTYIKEEANK